LLKNCKIHFAIGRKITCYNMLSKYTRKFVTYFYVQGKAPLHGKGFHKLKPKNWMKFFHPIYMCFIHVLNSRHLCATFINLWEIYFTGFSFSLLNCWMQSLWFFDTIKLKLIIFYSNYFLSLKMRFLFQNQISTQHFITSEINNNKLDNKIYLCIKMCLFVWM
jgi:hypothetical protein